MNPVYGFWVSSDFTATSFLSAGLITLAAGIGIVFGANTGATISIILNALNADASGLGLPSGIEAWKFQPVDTFVAQP